MRSLLICLLLCGTVFGEEWKPLTSLAPVGESSSVRVVRVTYQGTVPQAVKNATRSIGRVRIALPGGSSAMGSGAYVGANTVVTAKHVVRGGILSTTTIEFANQTFRGTGFLGNKFADQYLIQVDQPIPLTPIPFAKAMPLRGEIVYVAGFGGNRFRVWAARLADYGSAESQRDTGFYKGPPAISGDSGGAVLNARGEYIGTIWGGGSDDTAAVTYTQTRSFFQRTGLLARLFGRAGVVTQQSTTICYGERCPTPAPPPNDSSYAVPDWFQEPGAQPQNQPQPTIPPVESDCVCDCNVEAIANSVAEKLSSAVCVRAEMDTAEIEALINQRVNELRTDPALRGPKGNDANIAEADIASIVSQVIAQMPPNNRRVLLVDGKTKSVIDDETYGPNQPIVLDVQNIINAAKR